MNILNKTSYYKVLCSFVFFHDIFLYYKNNNVRLLIGLIIYSRLKFKRLTY